MNFDKHIHNVIRHASMLQSFIDINPQVDIVSLAASTKKTGYIVRHRNCEMYIAERQGSLCRWDNARKNAIILTEDEINDIAATAMPYLKIIEVLH